MKTWMLWAWVLTSGCYGGAWDDQDTDPYDTNDTDVDTDTDSDTDTDTDTVTDDTDLLDD